MKSSEEVVGVSYSIDKVVAEMRNFCHAPVEAFLAVEVVRVTGKY